MRSGTRRDIMVDTFADAAQQQVGAAVGAVDAVMVAGAGAASAHASGMVDGFTAATAGAGAAGDVGACRCRVWDKS